MAKQGISLGVNSFTTHRAFARNEKIRTYLVKMMVNLLDNNGLSLNPLCHLVEKVENCYEIGIRLWSMKSMYVIN